MGKTVILHCAGPTCHDGIDKFEMAGVGCEGNRHLLDATLAEGALGAEVIFDVTRPAVGFTHHGVVGVTMGQDEFTQNMIVGLPEGVGEHVEPTTVRHTDDDFFGAGHGCVADN